MSTVTITVPRAVKMIDGPYDSFVNDVVGTQIFNAIVYVDHQAQVSAGGDTWSMNLATLIGAYRRNGKTITVRSAAVARPGFNISDNVTLAWKTVNVSALPTISFIPVGTDYSTNAAQVDAADVLERPIGIFVAWSEA